MTGPQSIVADPERTDINRVWLGFKKDEWAGAEPQGRSAEGHFRRRSLGR